MPTSRSPTGTRVVLPLHKGVSGYRGALPTVEEDEATGEIARLYDDVRATVRSTFVPTVFRALAVHPWYLVAAWKALKPNLSTVAAESVAGELRVACVDRLKALVGPPRPPAIALPEPARAEIRAVLETFFYVIPTFVVAVTALHEAWQGRPIAGHVSTGPLRTLPRGAPASMPSIALVSPDTQDARVRRIFESAALMLGRPEVPTLYRTLARWPDYLETVWESIADPGLLAGYRAAVPSLIQRVAAGCRGLPFPVSLDRAQVERSLDAEAASAIESILITYQRDMPETLLQIGRLLRDLQARQRR